MKLQKLKILSVSALLVIVLLAVPMKTHAADDLFNQACKTAPTSTACQQVDTQKKSGNNNPVSGTRGILQDATNIFAMVAGTAGLLMLVYSGFVYVTAGGARAGDNATRAREARTTMVSAVTGIIIVALAWTIISYINSNIIH